MTLFFIAAAVLVVAALLFVLPPLLRPDSPAASAGRSRRDLNISIYQDQVRELERDLDNDVISPEQFEQGRHELERRMLEDVDEVGGEAGPAPSSRGAVAAAVLVAAAIPLGAGGLYMHFGAPTAVDPEVRASGGIGGMAGHGTEEELQAQIEGMVAQLEARLAANPEDGEGWAMLGRSYLWMERLDRAAEALGQAVRFNDRDPQLLVDYADALAMVSGRTLEGEPRRLIDRALALDPANEKALWLAGTAAYERADYGQALVHWQRLRELVPNGSEAAMAMDNNIAEVRSLMGSAAPPAEAGRGNGPAAAGSAAIVGTVDVASELRGRLPEAGTVFVYARASSGPRLPLAVVRVPLADFPFEFRLDDSMAMDSSMTLSGFEEVTVLARVSASGAAMTQSGDLQGVVGPVPTRGEKTIRVMIDEVVP